MLNRLAEAEPPVDLVALGHVTHDVAPVPCTAVGRVRSGGAVAFAARMASRLGKRAAVVTSAAPRYPYASALAGARWRAVPSAFTTTFHNRYGAGKRRQVLAARAAQIERRHVPDEWRRARAVLLAPVAGELPGDCAGWFDSPLIGAIAQGWLRRWDQYGRVSTVPAPPGGMLPGVDAIVASREEVTPDVEDEWARAVRVLVITEGAAGGRIHFSGRWRRFPAFEAREIDPTGAGDVWAAAFLAHLSDNRDEMAAARFASCAASLCVERAGLEGVPALEQIRVRLRSAQ